ncbi:hypothetical protein BGW38_003440, partial [Lunasporangiospora selenospora]
KKHRLFVIFVVNKDVSYANFIAYLLACTLTIALVVYLGIVQPFVFNIILGLRNSDNLGTLTGSLALYDEIIALPATLFWGVTSDLIGRRFVYASGFICLGTALILYQYTENVYPHVLLCRMLFSVGSSACTCMMTGTLSDIAGGQHERGRVAAMAGMFAGFGGLVGGMGLIGLPWKLERLVGDAENGLKMALSLVGGVTIGLAVIFAFTMPNLNVKDKPSLLQRIKSCFRKNSSSGSKTDNSDIKLENPFKVLKEGFIAGRDPRVALAYLSSFVARADTVLFTSYISLWVIAYGEDNGAMPLMRRSSVLAFAGVVGAVGSIPFAFTKLAPGHDSNMAFVSLVGIGQIGIITTGMTLVNGAYVPERYRGSVAGVYSFCGAISIMFMARLGGHLYDVWMRGAPFVLMGIAHIVIALFSIYVSIVTPRLEEQDRKRKEEEERVEMDERRDQEVVSY